MATHEAVVSRLLIRQSRMSESDKPLPYLDTFSKAAELGSFTAAADCLAITQAAVSQRIHALEKELGVSLFQRRGGRVFLTEEGQTLYGYAQRILDLHHEARQEVTGEQRPIAGDLLLAASTIPSQYLLPGILAVFHKQYPAIHVRANQTDSMGVLTQVEQGRSMLVWWGERVRVPTWNSSRLLLTRWSW